MSKKGDEQSVGHTTQPVLLVGYHRTVHGVPELQRNTLYDPRPPWVDLYGALAAKRTVHNSECDMFFVARSGSHKRQGVVNAGGSEDLSVELSYILQGLRRGGDLSPGGVRICPKWSTDAQAEASSATAQGQERVGSVC